MTAATVRPSGPVPRHALRRGTRGFAAFVLFLTALSVLAVAAFVLPASSLDRQALTVLIPLGIAFGIAHLVAIYGTLRRRAWVAPLTLYLVAIGLGAAAFSGLLVRAGVDPFAPADVVPGGQSSLETLGLVAWLAGSWLVAARFVVRGMAGPERGEARAVRSPGVSGAVRGGPVRGRSIPAGATVPPGRGVFAMGAYSR